MYWGKYVAHDNNRDGMGQFLALTQNVDEDVPRVEADDHARPARGVRPISTRRPAPGPYNEALDPITIDEWWLLAKNDVMEMTKRGVPGVWTYGFYDGWVPNYMFFIAHSHNAIGRFYEVQSYGPDNYDGARRRDDDEPRVVPAESAAAVDQVGAAQQHQHPAVGVLFALNHVAKNKEMYLENYWLKNKRAVDKGKNGPTYGWVIPGGQRRKADAADAVNELRRQGLEVHTRDGGVQGRQRRASRPATTSSAAISRTARSPTCTSRCRTTRRRTRVRTTTPAGRSSYMRNVGDQAGRPTRRCSTQPMTLLTGRREGAGRHRGHRAGASSSSTRPTTTW